MRKVFSIVGLLLTCIISSAQNSLQFTEIIEFEGKSKDEIFTQTKMWAGNMAIKASTFDREGGFCIIPLKDVYRHDKRSICDRAYGWLLSTIKIEIKDGKVKYSHYDFVHIGDNPFYPSIGLIGDGEWTKDDLKWKKELHNDLKNKSILSFRLNLAHYKDFIQKSNSDW